MLTIGPGAGPDWLMFQRDVRRQSSMCEFPYSQASLDETIKEGISVYPNPAQEHVTIDFGSAAKQANLISIYGANGQLIWSDNNVQSNETIATNSFPEVLYLYQIQFDNGDFETGKFVVSR